ncbi:MAG: hypothetical protein K9W43_01990 [Candidatus Thorarchaeota archaeon]|nr:hypothetical protein [Candidatus Thorarchaeota archaeon]
MTNRRSILGIWVIERDTGRNLVARAYEETDVDMDLIAPFLSATHTFIDRASNEALKTIDTESSRYVWVGNEHLLFVMIVSKAARIGHMRFLLDYALEEFMKRMIPEGEDLGQVLQKWHGHPQTFAAFGKFLDELVAQYEVTDDSLLTGKSMDCLEVHNHIFRNLMRMDIDSKTRKQLVKTLKKEIEPLIEKYPFLATVPIDGAGIEVLDIDIINHDIPYKTLREALEELFKTVANCVRTTIDKRKYHSVLLNHVMPYVKGDLRRLQTYAILDDVIRYLF